MISDKKILILGGSTFMGLSLVQMLDTFEDIKQIHCINRGNKYWYE